MEYLVYRNGIAADGPQQARLSLESVGLPALSNARNPRIGCVMDISGTGTGTGRIITPAGTGLFRLRVLIEGGPH